MTCESLQAVSRDRGAIVAFVAAILVVLLGMAALAVDVGYLYMVRGELQNAADSGALAGAQVLYMNNGQAVNPGADDVARSYVTQNQSEKVAATVQSIERGHWSFGLGTLARGFYPNNSTAVVDLWDATTEELDANLDFINAVRVRTIRHRVDGEVQRHFFAGILGIDSSDVGATAVAYIGYAGNLTPWEADQPLAICREALLSAGEYHCGVGRMINSSWRNITGDGNEGHETGGWTNFDQPEPPATTTGCTQPTQGNIPTGGNSQMLILGVGMGLTNGELTPVFNRFLNSWHAASGTPATTPWSITLPVVECPGNTISNCNRVVGAVEVDVIWISQQDKMNYREVPRQMLNPLTNQVWTCSTVATTREAGQQCWREFVAEFDLEDVGGATLDPLDYYQNSTVYFLPNCQPHIPAGTTGGQNFGILARIPVLVQ